MAKALKFNPGFQTDDETVANFVVRQAELDIIIGRLLPQPGQGSPNVMIVAPRGAGKTTLCRRVAAEVRMDARLSSSWHPIFLGEESYTVTTPGEFFLECLFQLRDQTPEAGLADDHREVAASKSEEELLNRSLNVLRKFSNEVGKRLLIIVENFHTILNDQVGHHADELIERLGDSSLFGVLATSVACNDDVSLPKGYLVLNLPTLDLEECRALWISFSGRDVKLDRIRPLRILTGGSPRLLHILAEFMKTPSLRDLMDNLNLLIDQNTEYFKSQLDALPATERKVFAALLDAWDPCSAKQVAETARVNTNIASAMLARLSDRGAVVKEQGKGRGAIYYAAERLFNIYYLMRRRSHPSSRVRALVSFMTEYYDRDELISTTAKLIDEACAVEPARRGEYYSWYNAVLSRAPEAVRRRIIDATPDAFFMNASEEDGASRNSKILMADLGRQKASNKQSSELGDISAKLDELIAEERFDEALSLAQSSLNIHKKSARIWLRIAIIELRQGNADEVIKAANNAFNIDANLAIALSLRGFANIMLKNTAEAEEDFKQAIKINPHEKLALGELAEIEQRRGNSKQAIALFRRATKLGDLSDSTTASFAEALFSEGLSDEGETLLRPTLSNPENFQSRRELVDHLNSTGRQEEAIDILRKAALDLKDWRGWADLGGFLTAKTERYLDAEAALKSAVEQGANVPGTFATLAHVKLHLNSPNDEVAAVAKAAIARMPENPRAWLTAAGIYHNAEEAALSEEAFKRAIALDKTAHSRTAYAIFLVSALGQNDTAEKLLRETIKDAEIKKSCTTYRALAELLVHNGEDAAAQEVTNEAAAKFANCTCCRVISGEISARAARMSEAKELFESALGIDKDFVPALTGLARLVDLKSAEQLIARAIEADPEDPRPLLARATIRGGTDERIADAEAALELDSDLVEAHLMVAEAKATLLELDDAFSHLTDALSLLSSQREYIPDFVATAMKLAIAGHGETVENVIAQEEFGSSLEPLSVALRIVAGETPVVAKEVLEVAYDIVARAYDDKH